MTINTQETNNVKLTSSVQCIVINIQKIMNPKQIIVVACGLSLLSVSAIAAKQITSQSTDQEIVKNWTQQIAQLEVKQALLEPIFTPDAPQFAQLI